MTSNKAASHGLGFSANDFSSCKSAIDPDPTLICILQQLMVLVCSLQIEDLLFLYLVRYGCMFVSLIFFISFSFFELSVSLGYDCAVTDMFSNPAGL